MQPNCTATTFQFRCCLLATERPKQAASGLTFVTIGPREARTRQPYGLLIRPIAKGNIRRTTFESFAECCRPTDTRDSIDCMSKAQSLKRHAGRIIWTTV